MLATALICGVIVELIQDNQMKTIKHNLKVKENSNFTFSGKANPIKHETLTQCWLNVGPLFVTLAQHLTDIIRFD